MKVIETDNSVIKSTNESFFGSPFVFSLSEKKAQKLADHLNATCGCDYPPRLWKVVEDDYLLQTGFKP